MRHHTSTTAATRAHYASRRVNQVHESPNLAAAGIEDSSTPQREERATRERLRAIRHARAAKAQADARRRAAVIRAELARSRAKDCRCPITPDSTIEDLRALGAGCTAGQWVCPTLDAIRRRLGR
ncbi:MAG: hypothetical protein ACYC0H_23190 [Solirubrobacteraceae bacterium]